MDTPLVHFIGFLLLTLQRPAGPLLGLLVKKYDLSLRRDAEFHRLVFSVASRFYGAAAAQQIFSPGSGAAAPAGSGSAVSSRGGQGGGGRGGLFGMGSGMPPGFLDMARSMAAAKQGGGGSGGSSGAQVETLD